MVFTPKALQPRRTHFGKAIMDHSVPSLPTPKSQKQKRVHNEFSALSSMQKMHARSKRLPYHQIFKELKIVKCGDEGDRTPNLRLAKPALSQLSYIPLNFHSHPLAVARTRN